MAAKVVDASVLGAFLFLEPRAEEAAALMEGSDLFAPALLHYELASISRKKIMRHADRRDSIMEALRVGLSLDIHLVQLETVEVVRLALESGLTTYDASYLHIARSLGIPIITFDEQLRSSSHS